LAAGLSSAAHTDSANPRDLAALESAARELAARLPDLLLEAKRVANTVAHGIHGRRRAGPGETFWQFRQMQAGDAVSMIDWRRSASSDHLYLREREWEAAHTIWLWPDLSPSMDYQSHIASRTKGHRAIVLMLAMASLLIDGGERIGLLGGMPATGSRNAVERAARHLLEMRAAPDARQSLPPAVTLSRFNGLLLFGDFLDPIDDIAQRLSAIASAGVAGHIVQVLDPAEESLPFDGRVEFVATEGADRYLSNRTENLREAYAARIAAHKEGLSRLAQRLQWSYLVHHTDRPAEEALLALHARLSGDRAALGAGSRGGDG
jgi:uncharacterized protein (DUF58 family)